MYLYPWRVRLTKAPVETSVLVLDYEQACTLSRLTTGVPPDVVTDALDWEVVEALRSEEHALWIRNRIETLTRERAR